MDATFNLEVLPWIQPIAPDTRDAFPAAKLSLFTMADILKQLKINTLLVHLTNVSATAALGVNSESALILAADREPASTVLRELKAECEGCDLPESIKHIDRLILALRSASPPTLYDCSDHLRQITQRITDELGSRLLLRIPSDVAKFYEQPALFGPNVNDEFEDAIDDIRAAGTCFAIEQYTAAVFHLMRVVEFGLGRLGRLAGMNDAKPSWESTLRAIDVLLKSPFPKWNEEQQKHKQFLEEIHPHLHAIKDGIRNKVDHVGNHIIPTAEFPPGKAEAIMIATRELMQRMTTELNK